MSSENILIVGANRGLGQALAHQYAKGGNKVYATARNTAPYNTHGIDWIPNIDITNEHAGHIISFSTGLTEIDLMVICAGYFAKETLDKLDYSKEIEMYKTAAIGPTFLVRHLVNSKLLNRNCRIVLVGGESGSIALRDKSEGGGNYGGHGSKAALNMVAKLLSIDLEPKGFPVAVVHTGYLRKQNADGFFDAGGPDAVKPEEAAHALREWIKTFDMSKSGQFWSVRGTAGIRSAKQVLGGKENLSLEPIQLPW